MKRSITLIVFLIVMSLLSGGCASAISVIAKSASTIAKIAGSVFVVSELDKSAKKNSNEPFSYSDYYEIPASTLMNALDKNAAAAATATKGKKIKIVGGKIGNIDSDGDRFNLDHSSFTISTITCFVARNSVAQKQLLDVQRGQQVDVYGRVTRVGDVLGYSVDVDRMELPGQRTDVVASNTITNSSTAKTPVAKTSDDKGASSAA